MLKLSRLDQVVYLVLFSLLNDATEFIRSRLCAPRFTRLTQTRLQIQSPDLRLEIVPKTVENLGKS